MDFMLNFLSILFFVWLGQILLGIGQKTKFYSDIFGKVQLFWEGHKNRPYGFEIYLVNIKTIRTIAQIFEAFSEKLNFMV